MSRLSETQKKQKRTDVRIITFNTWLIAVTKSPAVNSPTHCASVTGINSSSNRTTWMASNAIPDSIIMNMICRNFLPPVEPKVCSTEVLDIAPMTLRILNTIMPVIRAFTAMEATRPIWNNVFAALLLLSTESSRTSDAIQVTRCDKLKSDYQMKDSLRSTNLRLWLPRMKEWSRYEFFDPTRSNNGRSSKF